MPKPSLHERYLEFHAGSRAVFAQYPELEPLRFFVFRQLLIKGRGDGLKDSAKRWLRPLLKTARTRLDGRRADVLVWVETRREVIDEALLPVYRALVARGISTELMSYDRSTPPAAPARVFEFPARARSPQWAAEAWEALCDGAPGLCRRDLARSFAHSAAMLQGLYDELDRLLASVRPQVILCAATQPIGGAALMVTARRRGITALLLQHGMPGPDFIPLLADAMLMWGPSSAHTVVSLGLPRSRVLTPGSPRHDSMRPCGDGRARATLLSALGLSDRPTFVFFSQGHDRDGLGDAVVECMGWLERAAARYADAVNFVVRLHPNEDGALYRGCRHLTVMNRAVDLRVTLEGCDWIGSLCSTVLYDGLLYGRPAWQFYADDWPVYIDNWKTGLASRVSSEQHLVDMVSRVLSSGVPPGVDDALIARVFANHGRATQAVADVVSARLGTEQPRTQAWETTCDRSC